ncbi:MAG TPA: hypothetical protein VHT01_00310 [Candidatus Udaeobacter sp.]|nr:hypothetical protein [Candidatus Udaeobacter sp.]
MRLALLSLVLLAGFSLSAAEQSDPRFEKFMERSRKIFETNHMVVDLQLSSYDNKIPPAECHYDRYLGKVERTRLPDGSTFAKKEGGKWLESDDWGESGKPVKTSRSNELNVLAGYAVIPLKSKGESRDKSQVAIVVRSIDQRTDEEGDEELVFETGRAHQAHVNYPTYTFLRYKNAGPDDAVLYKFSGPIYSQGGTKVQLDAHYGYLIAVKMNVNVVTPPPASSRQSSVAPSVSISPGAEQH